MTHHRKAQVALALSLAMLCQPLLAQTTPGQAAPSQATPSQPPAPQPPPSTVYTNPRAGSDDPRVGLKAGLYDAGEAAFGMQHVISLAKPPGFGPGTDATATKGPGSAVQAIPGAADYGSINSDLAFRGTDLIVGNYNGINFYDISDPAQIKLRASLLCPGGQGDVSVYGHLLFMSAEAMNGRNDCGVQGIPVIIGEVSPPPDPAPAATPPAAPAPDGTTPPPQRQRRPPPPPSPDRFRGVRIFDISDLSKPKQVAEVQSCRGSHTHTLVIDPKDKQNVYIYISGTGNVRQAEELSGCSGGDPDKNPETALFRIDVIKVPLAHPEKATIVNSPRIFTDTQTGAINGLWKGGTHGEGTQTTSQTNMCHDITVYSGIGLAAGACSGNGILLDISDPIHPVRIDAVSDPNYAFWHSANFNNAGTKVLFTDEWGGGAQPRCREKDPMNWGADAIFTLSNRKLTLASYYKMPAPQTDFENCVAHNGSLVPIPGRDILVQSWYQGGISLVDFTDASHPMEIAYFDRGPIAEGKRSMGGQWSTYWYNGYIYGSEIARGVDVLKLVPNKYITQNEIDAANLVHFNELNVQNQPKITWPQNYTVARAYLDQLARSGALSADRIDAITSAMSKADAKDKKAAATLKTMGASLDQDASTAKAPADADRMHALAAIFSK